MDNAPPPASGARPDGLPGEKRRRIGLPVAIFFLVILLALLLHRCQSEPPPPATLGPPPPSGPARPASPEPAAPPPESVGTPNPPPKPPSPKPSAPSKARVLAPPDSGPYLWADPWGGRHFDSVRVALHCRQGCVVLYSLADSVNFKSYEDTLVFKRNATLWISGIDSLGRQAPPIRVDYVIERNPGDCPGEAMPVTANGAIVCMDRYEWPDSEGAVPRAFVTDAEAEDSCSAAG